MKKCPICDWKSDGWSANFCGQCGVPVIYDPDYEQILVKVDKYSGTDKLGFKHTLIDFDPNTIEQVWAIPYVQDTPELPMALEQHKNAFYQDRIHDWHFNIIGGRWYFKYHEWENKGLFW